MLFYLNTRDRRHETGDGKQEGEGPGSAGPGSAGPGNGGPGRVRALGVGVLGG